MKEHSPETVFVVLLRRAALQRREQSCHPSFQAWASGKRDDWRRYRLGRRGFHSGRRMSDRRELVSIRAARPEDGPAILAMLADLAFIEGATHIPRLDAAALARDVFGPSPKLNVLIAEPMAANQCRRMVGCISCSPNYSSWEGRIGIHIGDLWVSPAVRG
jgi:hypothetical protein